MSGNGKIKEEGTLEFAGHLAKTEAFLQLIG